MRFSSNQLDQIATRLEAQTGDPRYGLETFDERIVTAMEKLADITPTPGDFSQRLVNAVENTVFHPGSNLGSATFNENGNYNSYDFGYDGFNDVTVNVPVTQYNSGVGTFNENGTYNASDFGYDGFNKVEVNVKSGDVIYAKSGSSLVSTFNSPVVINNNVTSTANLFSGLSNFNQPVTIPDSVTNCALMFNGCTRFNQPITIPNSVTNCSHMFAGMRQLNQSVTIPDSVTNCAGMFRSSSIYANVNIIIGNNVVDCSNMFNKADFNVSTPATILISNSVTNCYSMFSGSSTFNQPVNIPDSVTECVYMFEGCNNFNSQVILPNSDTNCQRMFQNCPLFNKDITIPAYNVNCTNMFRNTGGFESNIYIDGTESGMYNFTAMFSATSPYHRKKIYCNNLALLNSTGSDSIIGSSITWTATTNGYYSSAYNIYLYNNYSAATGVIS